MLRGNVIGIGRGADDFDLAMWRQVPEVLQSQGSSGDGSDGPSYINNSIVGSNFPAPAPGSADEAIFDTRVGELPQVPELFLEIPDGRISRAHCLLSAATRNTAATDSSNDDSPSSFPTLRDISRNGTFLNGRKLLRGEEAPLTEGDRISLVLSVAPLSELAFIFHLGHPLATISEGPPSAQWVGLKGLRFSEERERTTVIIPGKDGIGSSPPSSPASLDCLSLEKNPPPPPPPLLLPAIIQSSPASSSVPSSPVPLSPSLSLTRAPSYTRAMKRSATSLYITPEAALAEPFTLHCQICLDTLKNAVALEPCGHSYCAICLSHHFGSCLEHGQAFSCPLRCSSPQQVVMNTVVRQLVEELRLLQTEEEETKRALVNERVLKKGTEVENVCIEDEAALIEATTGAAAEAAAAAAATAVMAAACSMHPAASLDDSLLPLSLSSLKDDKMVSILTNISHLTTLAPTTSGAVSPNFNTGVTAAVEALKLLTRLCWSDKESRSIVSTHGGVEIVVKCINAWRESGVVLSNGCIALVALIKGDDPNSTANRWQLGMCGGLEMLIKAMELHKNQSMSQLSCLLCLVVLAADGLYFQKEITKVGITTILSSMKQHIDCEVVVEKALLVIGALVRGGGADAIKIGDQIISAGGVELIAMVLKRYEGFNEDVLFACLFFLATLARQKEERVPSRNTIDGSVDTGLGDGDVRGSRERIFRMASAGVLPALRRAVSQYRLHHGSNGSNSDNNRDGVSDGDGHATGQLEERILACAAYLETVLERASLFLWVRRLRRRTQAACSGVLLWIRSTSHLKDYSTKSGGGAHRTAHRTARSRNNMPVHRRHFPWFRLRT